ncbi:hypothetical protein HN011_007677 [Eciton burchellii]|nr:hypothetical protein HN011_007677 [Eciton burchellii]
MENLNDINIFYPSSIEEEEKKILEPIKYILQTPIIQISKNLIQAFDYWLNIPKDKAAEIIEITHMIYVANLLIDDIQDNSDQRNGIPAAHIKYGIPITISAVYYALFNILKRIMNLQQLQGVKMCINKMQDAIVGQAIEIIWRNNFTCPSEADYKRLTTKKTAAFFDICVTLMQSFSTCDKDFSSLTEILGLYFQIRDDYCNLCSSDYIKEKGYGEDITEGKFSIAIIHALRTKPEDTEIKNILKQRTNNIELKHHCVNLLKQYGSLAHTKNILEELNAKARAEIDRLGGNPFLTKILDDSEKMDRGKNLIL